MKTIILMLVVLIILIGVVLLQILLSKAQNKWLGLILPLITLCFSIIAVLGIAAFTSLTTETLTITENGEVIEEIIKNTPKQPIANVSTTVFTVISVFIIYNIPTVILLAIYAACRGKKKKNLELERMNIQDLE